MFDFLKRNSFAAIQLCKSFADARHKFDFLGDFHQCGLIGQSTDKVNDELFVAHAVALHIEDAAASKVLDDEMAYKLVGWHRFQKLDVPK